MGGRRSGTVLELPQLSSHPANPPAGYVYIYPHTDGKHYMKNSAGVVTDLTATGIGSYTGPTIFTKRLAADVSRISATLTDTSDLSFPVVSGVTYHIKGQIIFSSSTATVGAKVGVTFPAGSISGYIRVPISATAEVIAVIVASGGSATGTAVATINVNYMAGIDLVFVATANGTFMVQTANETGTTAVTFKAGSNLIVTQVAAN